MIIRVVCNGFDDFSTEIYHVCRMFFDDVEVEINVAGEAAAEYELKLTLAGSTERGQIGDYRHLEVTDADNDPRPQTIWRLEADLAHLPSGEAWSYAVERTFNGGSAVLERRMIKRALGYALLQVLEQATEIEQPWGILTGVRPTKLLHTMLRQHTPEECYAMLREEYLVTEPKAKLLLEIAQRQLRVIPDLFALDNEVSLYIGIPFCPTKCAYCTFPAYDIRGNSGSVEAFLEGLEYEIRAMGAWMRERGLRITTIYWGGGTPTSIEAHEMDKLFTVIAESFPDLDSVRELTVEAGRPDTITPDKIEVMKKWRVDRISINPQSFTQATLDKIGRHHTVDETVDKFHLARQMGLNNINMDLILGLPDEQMEHLERTLAETAKLMPESLTVHTLSFKRASRMTKDRQSYSVADGSEIVRMMDRASEWTRQHGYVPYYMYRQKNILGNQENVGYSLPDQESVYNIVMMEERQTIIGLGCGAVSKILFPAEPDGMGGEIQRIERFPNPKQPSVYNSSYKEYVEKKIRLLDEVYGRNKE